MDNHGLFKFCSFGNTIGFIVSDKKMVFWFLVPHGTFLPVIRCFQP